MIKGRLRTVPFAWQKKNTTIVLLLRFPREKQGLEHTDDVTEGMVGEFHEHEPRPIASTKAASSIIYAFDNSVPN